MPREQVQWFKKELVHDSDDIHARQCCTYQSIVNVNKTNYPYLSSYEQEQTWTLTRTMSNNHKRYQSSIENIHLTMPLSFLKTKSINYENINIEKDRSSSILPPSQNYLSTNRSSSDKRISIIPQEEKILPITAKPNFNSISKNKPNIEKSPPLNKLMRIMHTDGKFIVRI
jgi:hypothetical protein